MRSRRARSAIQLTLAGTVLLSACGIPRSEPAASPERSLAGTYKIVICRKACDRPERALASGRLVLEDSAYPLAELPEPARAHVERRAFILAVIHAQRAPNACFVLDRTPRANTYAGITRVGVTKWLGDSGGTIRLPLFHSPDAGYVATLSIRDGEIHGRGRSWGGEHAGDGTIPPDSIVGRRLGPPDRSLCIRAAEAEAAAR
jgi:hypothetical protein